MATRIDTVVARDKLVPAREPYWTRVSSGCHLGFRKMSSSSTGTWVAKYRSDDGGRTTQSLGEFDEVPKSERFDSAMKAAIKWFEHLGKGGSPVSPTVDAVCTRYVQHLRETKPATPLTPYAIARLRKKRGIAPDAPCPSTTVRAADDAEARFKNYVTNDVRFAKTEMTKLTPTMIGEWRKRLRERQTNSGGNRGGVRTESTLNRDMTCFRAALNYAFEEGLVTSDFAWRGELRPLKDVDKSRTLYLDKGQRRTFIQAAGPDVAQFLRGLSILPLRPGALAALTVAHFDKRRGLLAVGKDKSGKDRWIKLPSSAVAFFTESSLGKLPSAPLLARFDGSMFANDYLRLTSSAVPDPNQTIPTDGRRVS